MVRKSSALQIAFVGVGAMALVAALGAVAQQPAPAAPPQARGPAAPAAPTGPLASDVYKNIQVLKDVSADQWDVTMRFVSAATGLQCVDCHVQETDGTFSYDKDDKRTKATAREMMKIERTVDGQFFNGQPNVTCYTCHRGSNRPISQPTIAEMYTADQLAAMAQQAAARAARGQGAAAPAAPGGGGGGGTFGRGGAPLPAVDDVVNKYVEALGGRANLEKLQTLVMSGTLTNRSGQKVPFTIEEKTPGKYREADGQPAVTRAFDGSAGWMQNGASTTELSGFLLQQATRIADLGLPLSLSTRYSGLRAVRGMTINGAATQGLSGMVAPYVTESLYFDSASGLLLRRAISTRTGLGTLAEQVDYSDYRDVAGVKLPFTIQRGTWDAVDTLTVVDVKPNAQVADARFARPR